MASSTKFVKKIISQEENERIYEITLSAVAGQGYSSVTGEVIDFTKVTSNPKLARIRPPAKPLPTEGQIEITKMPLGYTAEVKQAAASPTLANYVLRIYDIHAGAELTTADYPAGLAGKLIVMRVRSPRRLG